MHSTAGPEHVVTFYQSDDFVVEQVAAFISAGLAANEYVVAIATLRHWNAITALLDEAGVTYGRAAGAGQLVLIEADEMLAAVTADGGVSVDRFRAMVLPLTRTGVKTRIYGELVSLLAERGDLDSAIAIERLGHELAHTLQIEVLCGYRADGARPLTAGDVARIQAAHDRSCSQPALTPVRSRGRTAPEHDHFHAVRFYESRESLARIVAGFLGEGFAMRFPAIVIATPEHLDAIKTALMARSFDLTNLQAAGDLIIVDAGETLGRFMVDGMPDAERFHETIAPLLDQARRGRTDCVIRAYGEMVDVLWKAGQTAAAIRLETLWNQLAHTHRFALLCGYSMGHFYKDMAQQDIRSLHTHVVLDSGDPSALH